MQCNHPRQLRNRPINSCPNWQHRKQSKCLCRISSKKVPACLFLLPASKSYHCSPGLNVHVVGQAWIPLRCITFKNNMKNSFPKETDTRAKGSPSKVLESLLASPRLLTLEFVSMWYLAQARSWVTQNCLSFASAAKIEKETLTETVPKHIQPISTPT